MFVAEEPSSPSGRSSSLSPTMKDALREELIDWTANIELPPPTKADKRESPYNALSLVLPGLYLTCHTTASDRPRLMVFGVRLIVRMNGGNDESPYQVYDYDPDLCDLCLRSVDESTFVSRLISDCSLDPALDERAMLTRPMFLRSVAALDSPVYDIAYHFEELCWLMEIVLSRHRKFSAMHRAAIDKGGDILLPSVVVHCQAGVSRSVAVVLAYLMKRYNLTRTAALDYVQDSRPVASPNSGFVAQLTLWEANRGNRITDEESACSVAQRLQRLNSALELQRIIKDQLRVLTTSSRLVDDRDTFGRLVGHLMGPKLDASTLFDVVQAVVLEAVEEQLYVDSPLFFKNLVQLTASIKRYSPFVLAVAATSDMTAATERSTSLDSDSSSSTPLAGAAAAAAADAESSMDQCGAAGNDDKNNMPHANNTSPRADTTKDHKNNHHHAVVAPLYFVFEDHFHERILAAVSAGISDACEATEVLCKYLHALAYTQIVCLVERLRLPLVMVGSSSSNIITENNDHGRASSSARREFSSDDGGFSPIRDPIPHSAVVRPVAFQVEPGVELGGSLSSSELPPLELTGAVRLDDTVPLTTSCVMLPRLADAAIGFVEWATLDECVPAQVESLEDARQVRRVLCSHVLSKFLVVRGDGAVGAIGTKRLRRWGSCSDDPTAPSYLHFLRDDVEMHVFEALEHELAALSAGISSAAATAEGSAVQETLEDCDGAGVGNVHSSDEGDAAFAAHLVQSLLASIAKAAVRSATAFVEHHTSPSFGPVVLRLLRNKLKGGAEAFFRLHDAVIAHVAGAVKIKSGWNAEKPLDAEALLCPSHSAAERWLLRVLQCRKHILRALVAAMDVR